MRPSDVNRAATLASVLKGFDQNVRPLPGIHPAGFLDCLVEQLVESLRRIEFVHHVRDNRRLDPSRIDPGSPLFDPLKAAVLHHRMGNINEAYWLVFIATHFGKHATDDWRLARDVYGRLGTGGKWDWATISANPRSFRNWLAVNQSALRGRRFSNHRKYESLKTTSKRGTASVFETYVAWVGPHHSHQSLIREAHQRVGQNPRETFDFLYRSMNSVMGFGRLGKFDYLTMLGKLGIAPIDPGSAYLSNATGPLSGARLLFDGNANSSTRGRILDSHLVELEAKLNVGMQVLEDALCNWQKSPGIFMSFRG
jgi:hypothetical protein